jgi:hypothetical protein
MLLLLVVIALYDSNGANSVSIPRHRRLSAHIHNKLCLGVLTVYAEAEAQCDTLTLLAVVHTILRALTHCSMHAKW